MLGWNKCIVHQKRLKKYTHSEKINPVWILLVLHRLNGQWWNYLPVPRYRMDSIELHNSLVIFHNVKCAWYSNMINTIVDTVCYYSPMYAWIKLDTTYICSSNTETIIESELCFIHTIIKIYIYLMNMSDKLGDLDLICKILLCVIISFLSWNNHDWENTKCWFQCRFNGDKPQCVYKPLSENAIFQTWMVMQRATRWEHKTDTSSLLWVDGKQFTHSAVTGEPLSIFQVGNLMDVLYSICLSSVFSPYQLQ